MPIIKPGPGLLPEGEYVAQARKVQQEWSKSRTLPDGSKTQSHPVFKIPLHLPDGRQIIHRAHVTENTGDLIKQLCKSGALGIPEGEFILQPDDLERRKFYFVVKHVDYNGQKVASVNFHTEVYALQVNPALEGVSFPNEAPRGIMLRSATPPVTPPTEPPEASGSVTPKPPQPSVSDAAKIASNPMKASIEELESLSEEEFKEALEYAKFAFCRPPLGSVRIRASGALPEEPKIVLVNDHQKSRYFPTSCEECRNLEPAH
jgi:hypothetical protein